MLPELLLQVKANVKRGIDSSGLNLNCQMDGDVILVPIPK